MILDILICLLLIISCGLQIHTANKKYKEHIKDLHKFDDSKSLVVCSNVGIKPNDDRCNYCLMRKKCGAMKYVNSE